MSDNKIGARVSQAEQRRRSRQAEIVAAAAHTVRHFGRPELGDELSLISVQIEKGEVLPAKEIEY